MPQDTTEFDRLVDEALRQPFTGWDFSFVQGRLIESKPSWSYRQIVSERMQSAHSLLDMGTGGGEFLSSLQPLPTNTCATEGWPPNVPVARARLEPLDVRVFAVDVPSGPMPFPDGCFDLIINRHDGYSPAELRRMLKPGGHFVTQQVGGLNMFELNRRLQESPRFIYDYWTLDYALHEFESSGLRVVDAREDFPVAAFTDIGAVVFYLRIVSWQIEDFSVEKYRQRLLSLHEEIQRNGRLLIPEHRFLIEAIKP